MDAGETSPTGVPRGGGLRRLDRLPYRRRAMREPDRIGDRSKTIAPKQSRETRFDPANQIGAGEDQGRTELHHAGPAADLGIDVFGAGDPADTDQWQTPLGQPVDFGEQRSRPRE